MKHLKHIKEYFDMKELSDNHTKVDFKNLVKDETIIKKTLLDVIASQVMEKLPYFKDWKAVEVNGGILISKIYTKPIDDTSSASARLAMYIEVDEQDIIERERLEKLFYTINYASKIARIEGDTKNFEEYPTLFEDSYKRMLSVGGYEQNVDFKNNFGMEELVKFLKDELIPQIENTIAEFEKIVGKKIDRSIKVNINSN